MAIFDVRGAYRESGREAVVRLSAATADAARELASARGIVSENVEFVAPEPPPPPPVDFRDAWNDVRPPSRKGSEELTPPFAAGVCGVVSIMLYLVAFFSWMALINTIATPKGVTGIPTAELLTAVLATAAAALLHAASAALRLLARMAPRA